MRNFKLGLLILISLFSFVLVSCETNLLPNNNNKAKAIIKVYYNDENNLIIEFDNETEENLGSIDLIDNIEIVDGDLVVNYKDQDKKNHGSLIGFSNDKNVVLQTTDTHIQWRYSNNNIWRNLISLSLLGSRVESEIRVVETDIIDNYIVWKFKGEAEWNKLVSLDTLKGNPGTDGTPGEDGKPGTDGREIILSTTDDYLMWKYEGESEWKELLDLNKVRNEIVVKNIIFDANGNLVIQYSDGTSETLDYNKQFHIVEFADPYGFLLGVKKVMHGEDAVAPEPLSREDDGYIFIGWDDDITNITESKRVVALYELKKFSVKFYYEYELVKEEEIEYGNKLEKYYHDIDGELHSKWYLDANFSKEWDFNNYQVFNNINLYLKTNTVYSDITYDNSKVVIEFWHRAGGEQEQMFRKWIREFNQLYPNIKIVEQKVANDYDSLAEAVSLSIHKGYSPHIVEGYSTNLPKYLSSTVNLDELINNKYIGYSNEELRDFIEGIWNDEQNYDTKGTTRSLPFLKTTEALYYNELVMEKYGINEYLEKGYLTWDEIFEMSERIRDIEGNVTPFGYDSSSNLFITASKQWNAPYTDFYDNGDPNILIDNIESKEMIKYFKDKIDRGLMTVRDIESRYMSDIMKMGLAPYMYVGSTGGARYSVEGISNDIFNNGQGYKVGVAPIPVKDINNRKQLLQGSNFSLLNKENPQEVVAAWLFSKFMLDARRNAEMSLISGNAPIRYSAYDTEIWKDFENSINNNPTTVRDAGQKAIYDSIMVMREGVNDLFSPKNIINADNVRIKVQELTNQIFSYNGSDLDNYINRLYSEVIDLYDCENFSVLLHVLNYNKEMRESIKLPYYYDQYEDFKWEVESDNDIAMIVDNYDSYKLLINYENYYEGQEVLITLNYTYRGIEYSESISILVEGYKVYKLFESIYDDVKDGVLEFIESPFRTETLFINGVTLYGETTGGYYLTTRDGTLAYVNGKNYMPEYGKFYNITARVYNYFGNLQLDQVSYLGETDSFDYELLHKEVTIKDVNDFELSDYNDVSTMLTPDTFLLKDVKLFIDTSIVNNRYNLVIVSKDFDPATALRKEDGDRHYIDAIMVYYTSEDYSKLRELAGLEIDELEVIYEGYRDDKHVKYVTILSIDNVKVKEITDVEKLMASKESFEIETIYHKPETVLLEEKGMLDLVTS